MLQLTEALGRLMDVVDRIKDLSLKPENSQYFLSLDNLLSLSSKVKKIKLGILQFYL